MIWPGEPVFALAFALCVIHSLHLKGRYATIQYFVPGLLYSALAEIYWVTYGQYRYPVPGITVLDAPLSIIFGWNVVTYVCMEISSGIGRGLRVREPVELGLLDGAIALSYGFFTEPVAERLDWWTYHLFMEADFLGVPIAGLPGWGYIISCFTVMFRLVDETGWSWKRKFLTVFFLTPIQLGLAIYLIYRTAIVLLFPAIQFELFLAAGEL